MPLRVRKHGCQGQNCNRNNLLIPVILIVTIAANVADIEDYHRAAAGLGVNEVLDLFPEIALLKERFDAAGLCAGLLQEIVDLVGDEFIEDILVLVFIEAADRINGR